MNFAESKDDDDVKKVSERKLKLTDFIDDEAELSGDDVISEDEADLSDYDRLDPELIDDEAKDLDSDEEEAVRRLYHKQLETDDKRRLLLLQEHLEDNELAIGRGRRRKFRWQTKNLMETSLKRHYDPDDDDSQEGLDEDDYEYDQLKPRLRRPTGEALMIGSTKISTKNQSRILNLYDDDEMSDDSDFDVPTTSSKSKSSTSKNAGPSLLSDESNSNTTHSNLMQQSSRTNANGMASDMNRYLFRDREVVEALSTREAVVVSREDKDRVIQRELKKVLTSQSVFDQLYS